MMAHALARRAAIGFVAGLVSSSVLVAIDRDLAWTIVGVLAGVAISMAFGATSYLERSVTAATLGLPLWCLVNIIALPLFVGREPLWSADGMRSEVSGLVGWMLFGAIDGLIAHALVGVARLLFGPEATSVKPAPEVKTRIVIVGGGFGGVTTAQYLEQAFGADRSVSVTLISEANALLFTPMLAEVAGSSLEPTHISTPLRTTLRRTMLIRARATGVDFEGRRVQLAPAPGPRRASSVPFDHLVLALGSVSHYVGLDNVQRIAFDFKTLGDAIRIRNHLIDVFERADTYLDPVERRALLTIVVAGGGFAGTELAGALNDFTRGMLVNYPNIARDELRIILVHSRDRILPELSASLAGYARERMAARGVTFKLGARVADARPGLVVLNPLEEIPCHTLIWTAGVSPNPLLGQLALERDARGAVVVDSTLAVRGQTGVWAVGDCAYVVDARTGRACPPTAQFALREAATVARNIHASVKGRRVRSFHFSGLGTLCVVGHHTACAEIRGVRFSGFLAWVLWRAIYLAKLPGFDRKVRVVADWIVELFFPRDIVQTVELGAGTET